MRFHEMKSMKQVPPLLGLLRSYTMRVPLWIRLVVIIAAFGIPIY